MLMPHPATLRRILTEYETVLATTTGADAHTPGPRLRDLAYTLCVSTGTREIAHALQAAHDYLDHTIDTAEDAGVTTGTGRARVVVTPGRLPRSAGAPLLHS
ncbi:DUF5133 domain-containing protein [Streptomyces sp. NPDC059224]|uniref:DUF5133 domain-containing protein n=1 Tax=Streptomyces sp. NPDC059224 TaxID=3346775 RepID=UPI0036AA2633